MRRYPSSDPNDANVLLLHGMLGVGKTTVALSYCKNNPTALYFPFRNLEARLVPAFFSDRDMFYTELKSFLCNKNHKRAFVVLILRKPDGVPFIRHQPIKVEPLAIGDIYKQSKPHLSSEDALRLFAVTGGIPALCSLYDCSISVADNMRRFLCRDSAYCHFAETFLRDSFRAPECYFTLLYAMATGHNRISELAAYSGFPNNKCDKYLKTLLSQDLIETVQRPDETGRMRTHYDVKNSYMKLWLRYVYPARVRFFDMPSVEEAAQILNDLDCTIVKEVYRKACFQWLKEHPLGHSSQPILRLDAHRQYNVQAGNYTFDFVQKDGDQMLIVKIWDEIGYHVSKDDYVAFEEAAMKLWPFHRSTLVLFATHRFSDYCWENAGKFENMHLVQVDGLRGKR